MEAPLLPSLPKENSYPVVLIAGDRFIQKQALISMLAEECNITIIERSLKFEEDLILDERNMMIFYDLASMTTRPMPNNTVDAIMKQVMRLSVRYERCWCILEAEDAKR